ncbi:hypothetical protein [Nocardia thailandica]|uniref:hypothetical protein n=1 Tax=Nocardia thailandica TaxID=257275 RepID=UPI0002F6418D|nr:hypothetical protein [Nocardia thailandica]
MLKTTIATLTCSALIALGGPATTEPTPTAETPVASSAAAILISVDETGQPVSMCMMPGDTLELRAGIGAAIGAFAGLPIFIIGAVPGALIGAGFGALSWWIADQQRHRIPGPC